MKKLAVIVGMNKSLFSVFHVTMVAALFGICIFAEPATAFAKSSEQNDCWINVQIGERNLRTPGGAARGAITETNGATNSGNSYGCRSSDHPPVKAMGVSFLPRDFFTPIEENGEGAERNEWIKRSSMQIFIEIYRDNSRPGAAFERTTRLIRAKGLEIQDLPIEDGFYIYKNGSYCISADPKFVTQLGEPVVFSGCRHDSAADVSFHWNGLRVRVARIDNRLVPRKDLKAFYYDLLKYLDRLDRTNATKTN